MRMALKLLTSSIVLLVPRRRQRRGMRGMPGGLLRASGPGWWLVFETSEVDTAQIWQRVGRGVLGEVDLFFILVEDLHIEP